MYLTRARCCRYHVILSADFFFFAIFRAGAALADFATASQSGRLVQSSRLALQSFLLLLQRVRSPIAAGSLSEMLVRVDKLAALGVTVVTISRGWPLLSIDSPVLRWSTAAPAAATVSPEPRRHRP